MPILKRIRFMKVSKIWVISGAAAVFAAAHVSADEGDDLKKAVQTIEEQQHKIISAFIPRTPKK